MDAALPTLFISHGGPTILVDRTPAHAFLAGLGGSLPRPRAILSISAHWLEPGATVSGAAWPETIHDFYGFPREFYDIHYAAPGAPDVARRVAELLTAAGVDAAIDPAHGLDHGTWVPALLSWPAADIPILQLSLLESGDAAAHLAVGRALRPLRDEGVLIIGSGSATHNLGALLYGRHDVVLDWARAFDDWLAARLSDGDVAALLDWKRAAPSALKCHPTDEHFLPLFVALGAASDGAKGRALHRSVMHASLSMASYAFD